MNVFLATLNPMLTLFLCIAVGFVLYKCKLLPENAGSVIAKLETWVFCPALSFMTMQSVRLMPLQGQKYLACGLMIVQAIAELLLVIPVEKAISQHFSQELSQNEGDHT